MLLAHHAICSFAKYMCHTSIICLHVFHFGGSKKNLEPLISKANVTLEDMVKAMLNMVGQLPWKHSSWNS